ncbi:hypothetical protein [Streptomyces ramulosus]|uniref:Aminoglycoside phosphotransferase domain-containing protein n=1 Tax=Streptomyces ramulosus TaxID=47762 RepID=A0ABW1FTV8_9ACTN
MGTLDQVREVQNILAHTGLGPLAGTADLRRLPSRNRNWICTTDSGTRVFVKKLEVMTAQRRLLGRESGRPKRWQLTAT